MLDEQSSFGAIESKKSSGRGGRRTGAGRPKGAVDKVTKDVRLLAQKYSDEAFEALATILKKGESEQARIAAAKEILDRAYGKSTQPVSNEDDKPFRHEHHVTAGQAKVASILASIAAREEAE